MGPLMGSEQAGLKLENQTAWNGYGDVHTAHSPEACLTPGHVPAVAR